MFIDARTIPNNQSLESEVCIIGAGAAGITLALEFIDRPFRVILLESGNTKMDYDTQSLYGGENIGLPYYPHQTSRLRFFGGTTNHWGGYCRPFNESDFEAYDWVPYSGWPIGKADVQPFYERAASICSLGSSNWDLAYWEKHNRFPLFPLTSDRVTTTFSQLVSGTSRSFGAIYYDVIDQAENITTYLNANVTEIETDEPARSVTHVSVACLNENKFSVKAKLFILAVGGMENARLLLLSNKRQANGLGNQNDLVGRFFLEHPRLLAGKILPSHRYLNTGFYKPHRVKGSVIKGYLSLSENIQIKEKLLDVQISVDPTYDESYLRTLSSKDTASFRYLLMKLKQRRKPDDFGRHLSNIFTDLMSWRKLFAPGTPFLLPNPQVIDHIIRSRPDEARFLTPELLGNIAVFSYGEIFKQIPVDHLSLTTRVAQAPNPDSRITLSEERDQLGQNRIKLDWRLSPIDKHSIVRTLEIIGAEIGRTGLGRLQIVLDDDATAWPGDLRGGWHHMGTTRMSDNPKQGVVDKNCQVHGISNLFIAGSSVFPTAGSGTPTLTLVALALRLAEHIKEQIK